MAAQFSDLPVLPDWPSGLADFECHAFPDDARPADTILVAVLSIAAALPVTFFIFICFDLANDNDPPNSFLRWPLSWPALVWGTQAHRRWHYLGEAGQPPRFVRWFVRFRRRPVTGTMANLVIRAWCTLTRREMPWEVEAREEAEKEKEKERLERQHHLSAAHPGQPLVRTESLVLSPRSFQLSMFGAAAAEDSSSSSDEEEREEEVEERGDAAGQTEPKKEGHGDAAGQTEEAAAPAVAEEAAEAAAAASDEELTSASPDEAAVCEEPPVLVEKEEEHAEVIEEKEAVAEASEDEAMKEEEEREEEAREEEEAEDIRFKQALAWVGLVAVYVSWVRPRSPGHHCGAPHLTPARASHSVQAIFTWFIFVVSPHPPFLTGASITLRPAGEKRNG